ncbi:hypothetical protein MLD38_029174 [Melastoma candidum]|uniref:Uncharacterized protein n=1 Tax=Melastoma candidum TaxID=119954 RepID=A0ACB9N3B6_9MYRT|nr:hypothetical protein MLD38_029174 [Melastoma candidum]
MVLERKAPKAAEMSLERKTSRPLRCRSGESSEAAALLLVKDSLGGRRGCLWPLTTWLHLEDRRHLVAALIVSSGAPPWGLLVRGAISLPWLEGDGDAVGEEQKLLVLRPAGVLLSHEKFEYPSLSNTRRWSWPGLKKPSL